MSHENNFELLIDFETNYISSKIPIILPKTVFLLILQGGRHHCKLTTTTEYCGYFEKSRNSLGQHISYFEGHF